jgi:hypothetical protein
MRIGLRESGGAGGRVADIALPAVAAFALTAAPILLHLVSQPLAIAFCLTTSCFVALYFERAIPFVILVSYLFQTMFVAMASPYVAQYSDLDPMKAYNFITTVGFWLTLMARLALGLDRASPFLWRLVLATTAVLALAGIFFVLGLSLDSRGATIYMRNIGLPVMLFQICLLVASRRALAMRETSAFLLAVLLACGYLELFATRTWLDFTNGWTYWDLASTANRQSVDFAKDARTSGVVITDTIQFLTTNLFNTALLSDLPLRVVRLQGPNFHPISFGYALAIISAFVAVHGGRLAPLLAVPLLIVVGAKGALALLVFSLAFCFVSRFYQGVLLPLALAAVLALYAAFVFYEGWQIGDFHVLGLIGGINGFLSNPAGHTLGAGGNLSTNFAGIDWSKYQHAGATDIAVESAAGVLLFQMGVAGLAVVAIYLWLAKTAWRLFRSLRAPALALAAALIVIMMVNGLFQEEAWFAPLALGLALTFAGLTFGAVDRRIAAKIREARRTGPGANSLAAAT